MSRFVIFSRGAMIYSTQRLQYEAVKRGHKVDIMDHLYCRAVISQDGPQLFYGFDALPHFDAAIPRIGHSVTYMGSMVIRHCERHNIPITSSSYGLSIARDKLRCYELLSAHGIPVPKTVYTSPYNEEDSYDEDLPSAKMIIKLLGGTQGIGVILTESKTGARSIIETFRKLRKKVLLQEYIEESSGSDIRIFVVGNRIVASMIRSSQNGDFRSNIHRGGVGKAVELTDTETKIAVDITKLLKLEVAGIDILRSDSGPLVLEVNPSPGLEGIEQYTKINVARKIIEHCESLINEKQNNNISINDE